MVEYDQKSSGNVLGHEGPTLIDFRKDSPRFELGINGPGLLFTALEVRTSLYLQDGCDYAALRRLIDGFTVTAFCGHSPPERVAVRIAGSTLAPYVSIDVGPPSMYMSHLQFDTDGKETFAKLCDRTLNPLARGSYLVALVPILNNDAGHGEHRSHAHDHALMPMAAELDVAATPRPKYRIEYVLPRKKGNN